MQTDRAPSPHTHRVVLLGSTGSVGTQTLACIEHLNALAASDPGAQRFEVVALAAGTNGPALAEQASDLGVRHLALADDDSPLELAPSAEGARLFRGDSAAEDLVRFAHAELGATIVVAAIVGSAGLPATLAAAELGLDIALANKETLVAAGALITSACRASGARLLPVDSEHAALWHTVQAFHEGTAPYCPPDPAPAGVRQLILTASGGPFRDARLWPADRLRAITPSEALAHPTWDMGAKVTLDCASLTNKALELIEAHWLFGLAADQLSVAVHPQSVVHSMAEGIDGSIIAQLGPTDMRAPIQQALTFPARVAPAAGRLDVRTIGSLDFEPPDEARFGALALARRVMDEGGASGAVFNAANEIAARAFLAGAIPFTEITPIAARTMDALGAPPVRTLADVLAADAEARAHAEAQLAGCARPS